ncbi:MAG: double zinc ribbon domain-containing protein [Oscillospiraceae bacterium]|jgi:ComF family protein|nr:double zinc ribbon domain-containing protein [Oscillospiraceae bacterium]
MNLYELKRVLLSFIYPNRCPFCGKIIKASEFFCKTCLEFDFYANSGDNTYCCVYNEKSKPLLTKAKENADGYAISAVARLMLEALIRNNIIHKINVIVPIPPRKTALKQRGYSFPAFLARELAQLSGKKYSLKTLVFVREIEEQKGLSAAWREENLKGAFTVGNSAAGALSEKNVLVIDDVSTTGATLNEAKRVLSEFAGNVYIASFAKT